MLRVINQETDMDPVLYYIHQTGPMDWTVKTEAPMPIQLWRNGVGPLLKALVGMTGLGLLVMLGRQLFVQDYPLKRTTLPFIKEMLTFSAMVDIEWLLKKILSMTAGTRMMQRFA